MRTLHPKFLTLTLKVCTLYPHPNPNPSTLNPKLEFLNPAPYPRPSPPYTLNTSFVDEIRLYSIAKTPLQLSFDSHFALGSRLSSLTIGRPAQHWQHLFLYFGFDGQGMRLDGGTRQEPSMQVHHARRLLHNRRNGVKRRHCMSECLCSIEGSIEHKHSRPLTPDSEPRAATLLTSDAEPNAPSPKAPNPRAPNPNTPNPQSINLSTSGRAPNPNRLVDDHLTETDGTIALNRNPQTSTHRRMAAALCC